MRPVDKAAAAGIATGLAALVVLQPLAVYSLALAAFGLPHVLSELRFIDRRFGRDLKRSLLIRLLCAVPLLLLVRLAVTLRWLPIDIGAQAELAGLAALALLASDGRTTQSLAAAVIGGLIEVAALFFPFDALVWVAVLHNLTPLGFFWGTASAEGRPKVMGAAVGGLIALPLLIATGLPRRLLQPLASLPMIDPLHAGPLAKDLFVYVPSALIGSEHAVDIFAASVAAQCAHYLCVILLLPATTRQGAAGIFRWPSRGAFAAGCGAIGALSALRFWGSFADARTIYSLLAAAHVWIEVPILIAVLSPKTPPLSSKTTGLDGDRKLQLDASALGQRPLPAGSAQEP